MRIAWFVVEDPVAVLPRASVGPHSIEPSTELGVLNATRNDEESVSHMEGPRVRLCACNDGSKQTRREARGLVIRAMLRMIGIRVRYFPYAPSGKSGWRTADYFITRNVKCDVEC